MTPALDLIDQGRRLESMTAQTHILLIESELALGLTFCMVVETQIRLGEIGAARQLVPKVERTVEMVRRSIGETGGLPTGPLNDPRKKLAYLEKRVKAVELKLNAATTRLRLTAGSRLIMWGQEISRQ